MRLPSSNPAINGWLASSPWLAPMRRATSVCTAADNPITRETVKNAA